MGNADGWGGGNLSEGGGREMMKKNSRAKEVKSSAKGEPVLREREERLAITDNGEERKVEYCSKEREVYRGSSERKNRAVSLKYWLLQYFILGVVGVVVENLDQVTIGKIVKIVMEVVGWCL